MEGQDLFGIDVSKDGRVNVFLKLHERYGYAWRAAADEAWERVNFR